MRKEDLIATVIEMYIICDIVEELTKFLNL